MYQLHYYTLHLNYYILRFLVIFNTVVLFLFLNSLYKLINENNKIIKLKKLELYTYWLVLFAISLEIIRLTYMINTPLLRGYGLIWSATHLA